MRTLSSIANQERLAASQDVVWLLEIDWPDAARGYATRPLALGSFEYAPWLLGFERLAADADGAVPPRQLAGESAKFRLANVGTGAENLDALARRYDPKGLACRLRLFFWAAADQAGADDVIEVFHGEIESAQLKDGQVEFAARDFLRAAASRRIGRPLSRALFPGIAPEDEGAMAPWIFGEAVRAPLIALDALPETRIAGDLAAEAAVVPVESLTGFAASGTIQIGGEAISYGAVDLTNRTFGTPASPVGRNAPEGHSSGALARQVPPEGFAFLAADHSCLSVSNVEADGQAVAAGDYSTCVEEIDGIAVQKVVFPLWPAVASSPGGVARMAERLTATAQGRASGGALIDNPADAIQFLLMDSSAGALAADRIDFASFSAARAALTDLGIVLAARIDRRESLERLLAAVLFESRADLVVSGGVVRLLVPASSVEPADAVFAFDPCVILGSALNLGAPDGGALTDLTLLYKQDFSETGTRRHAEICREALGESVFPHWARREAVVDCRWLGSVAVSAARAVASYHVARSASRFGTANVEAPLRAIHLDRADPVTVRRLPDGESMVGRIAGWRMTALDRLEAAVALESQSIVCWAHGHSASIARVANGSRLDVFIGGARAASFELSGTAFLEGVVIEDGLGDVSMNAPVKYDEENDRICFGARSGGHWQAGFAIDFSGNLLLRGAAVEETALDEIVMDGWMKADASGFAIGIGGVNPVAYYDAAARELKVKGQIQEN